MATLLSSLTLPRFIFEQPAISILLPVALGTSVGYANRPRDTQEKYLAIQQPPLRPPPYVFGPVWTALYAAMGYAAHRAWTVGSTSGDLHKMALARHGATLYTIQLGLNLIWMPLFFGYGRPVEATVDIVALTGTTVYLTYVWSQIDLVAAWTMVPYIAWLSFATYLCAGAGYLNDWTFEGKFRTSKSKSKSGKGQ